MVEDWDRTSCITSYKSSFQKKKGIALLPELERRDFGVNKTQSASDDRSGGGMINPSRWCDQRKPIFCPLLQEKMRNTPRHQAYLVAIAHQRANNDGNTIRPISISN